jgi:sucrose-6-phosphate hydrolase SacC (GH32 family)
MFKWKKLGQLFNPVELKGNHWMKEYAQAPSVLIFDTYVRVYFSSRPLPDGNGQHLSRLGFIDLDRENLFKIINICLMPILPLGLRGTFDEFGTYPASVIRTGNEIRVYYAGWTRCESVPFNAAIGLAVSNDQGESFRKIGEGPILSFTPDEPYILGSPKIRRFKDTWYLWYSSGRTWLHNNGSPQPVYKIRMAQSTNGIEWTRCGKNLIDDSIEENECQASPDVFYYKGVYHMFFSYRYCLNFKEKGRGYKIGYAWSNDLENWFRDDTKAGIDVSETGWDSDSISYGFVFELDNHIYMLHQGNEIGRYGFGLAQMESYS